MNSCWLFCNVWTVSEAENGNEKHDIKCFGEQFIQITNDDGVVTGILADESGNVISDETLSMVTIHGAGNCVWVAVRMSALIDTRGIGGIGGDLEWDRCDRQVAFLQGIVIVSSVPRGVRVPFHLRNWDRGFGDVAIAPEARQ